MNAREEMIINKTLDVLDELKAMPTFQLCEYVTRETGLSEALVKRIVEKYGKENTYIYNEHFVQKSDFDKPNRKQTIAFWAFTAIPDTEGKFRRAKWPASLIFRMKDDSRLFRITVCDNADYDADVEALKQLADKKKYVDIIASTESIQDINKEMLPEADFIYAHVTGEIFNDVPEIKFVKVTCGQENDENA